MNRKYQIAEPDVNEIHLALLASRDDAGDAEARFNAKYEIRIAICFHLLRWGIKAKIINLFDLKPKNRRSQMQMKF